MADEAERYWVAFEAETGERVVSRAMGRWFRDPDPDRALWGLLVLTDRSFRFRHLPSDSWVTQLFRAGRPEDGSRAAVELVVPLADLVSVAVPRPGLLERIFRSGWPEFSVAWRDGGDERTGRFSADDAGDFTARLGAIAAGKGAGA